MADLAGGTSRRPVIFVNQYYSPAVASTGQHLTDLAEFIAARGVPTAIVCARSTYESGRLDAPSRETRNGVVITRLWTTAFGREKMAGRLLDYFTFLLAAFVTLLLRRPRPRIIIFLTTPPMLPALGPLIWLSRRVPYGIWSMDLHPEAEEAVGMFQPGGFVSRAARAIAGWFYRGATLIVALGPYMKHRIIAHGADPVRVLTIPVWTRDDEVFPVPREDNRLLAEAGLRDAFVVMYSGNAGMAHTFDVLLESMQRLDGHGDIRFLFVGGGPKRKEILRFAEDRKLGNLIYRAYYPRAELASSLSMAHVHLLTLRHDMAGVAVPGKLFGIMAVGRPVLMIGPLASEPATIVQESGCGWVVDPLQDADPVGAVTRLLRDLHREPEELSVRGRRGLKTFRRQFRASKLLPLWAEVLERESGST